MGGVLPKRSFGCDGRAERQEHERQVTERKAGYIADPGVEGAEGGESQRGPRAASQLPEKRVGSKQKAAADQDVGSQDEPW